jgi:hypothetical protein
MLKRFLDAYRTKRGGYRVGIAETAVLVGLLDTRGSYIDCSPNGIHFPAIGRGSVRDLLGCRLGCRRTGEGARITVLPSTQREIDIVKSVKRRFSGNRSDRQSQ